MPSSKQRRGNVDLGAAIKAARSARGLSRDGLGSRLGGVHPDTIGAWERGDWLPGPQNVQSLARVLELPPDRLEQLLVLQAEGGMQLPTAERLSVAGWREVLSWGWTAHDLSDHLLALDDEAFGPGGVERGSVEHWAPIYAQVPECWRLVCSRPRHVVANWGFLPLAPDAYEAYRAGELLETEIGLDQLDLLLMPGLYRAVVIDFVIRPAWTTAGVRLLLFRSLFAAMAELARLGIYFEEVAAHCHTLAGKGLCRSIGMAGVGEIHRAPGAEVFVLPLLPLPASHTLSRDAELSALYCDVPLITARPATVRLSQRTASPTRSSAFNAITAK
jgi:transcriptional regulator with XRE-family HTH domain